MKQIFWLVVMVVWAILGGIAAEANQKEKVAEVFIIDGYLPEQVSVKGVAVEGRINELTSRLRAINLNQDEKLLISIIGSADSSGKSRDNEQLAKTRAERVEAVLLPQFPNAVIKSLSIGDDENIRQVKVIYTVETEKVVKEVQNNLKTFKGISILFWILVAILVFSVFIILYFYIYKYERFKPQEVQEKKSVVETIEMDGYVVPIEHHDGFYWSPFVSKSGSPIRRENFADIKRSLKGCLENSEFAQQKERLIKQGTIKKKGGE